MKQILLSLLTVLIFSGTLLAQTSQTKTKANAGRQPENGSESRSNETDEHGHHRFYKDTLLAKAGIFYDSLSLKGYRVLTTAQLQGNANYLAKFSANQTLVNSLVQDNGTRLLVNGAMSIRDSANINGLLTVGALTSLGNGLNVNGATNFNGITNLNNAVIIKGPVTANALTSLGAGLTVKGTTNFSDSVNVNGVSNLNNSVIIKGPVTANALTSLGAGLSVKGATNFSDSVNVSGTTSLNGTVIVKGPLTANALTSLGAGLNVKGTTNLSDSVNVNAPININALMSLVSGLNVTGATNLNGAVVAKGPLTANSLTSLSAGLNVKGTTNFSDSVNVNGPININTLMSLGSGLNVNGATNLNGAVVAQGPLTSNALTSLTAGLNVKGITNFSDSVNMNGPININAAMSLGSGLNVNGATNLNGTVVALGPVTVNATTNLGAGLNVNGPVVLKNGLTLQALPAGQTTDSLLTIGTDGTVKRKDASLLFNPHPSFSDLSLSGPLTGTTAQFSNGLSLGSTNSVLYQWQVAGGNPYLALSTAANANAFTLQPNGNIGIGTAAPGNYQLAVEGAVGARKLKITQASTWADYVFEPSYQLQPLPQVEAFIKEHKHLPEVPSAKEVAKNGIDMGETTVLLLKKIEELTLYMIEMKKENEEIRKENRKQHDEIELLKKQPINKGN